jgi:conjugative transfer region protein (TIGR03750 family)
MKNFDGTNHSLRNTLERLDFEPPVVAGLTGDELFTIALVLQGFSLLIFLPLIGFFTGIWVLAFGVSLIIGILSIGFVGRKIAKEKEKRPADIVWLDYRLMISGWFHIKSDVLTKNQNFSCERMKPVKKRKN